MFGSIRLEETEVLGEGIWRAELQFKDVRKTLEIRDPFLGLESYSESSLRWLLDDYAVKSPYDTDRAENVKDSVKRYGSSLLDQLHLEAFVRDNVEGPGYDIVAFDVSSSDPVHSFQKLHWETLEEAWQDTCELDCRILVRRKVTNQRVQSAWPDSCQAAKTARSRSTNVLMVACRPRQRDDIDPLLGANSFISALKALQQMLEKTDRNYKLEVVRPGTWIAFKAHLQTQTQLWWQSGGVGPWYDLVHFDMHGSVWQDRSYLHFSSANGKGELWRSADKIARRLARFEVQFVILNACDSARDVGSTFTCMARQLVEAGIHTVVGMSYKLTSSAARTFLRALYFRLLMTPIDPWSAFRTAREALAVHAQRCGRLGQVVELPDHIVPVIYICENASRTPFLDTSSTYWRLHDEKVYEILYAADFAGRQAAIQFATPRKASDRRAEVLGRDYDILEIERVMFQGDIKVPGTYLLEGVTGIGKTVFAKYLARWWEATGCIGSLEYFSFRVGSLSKAVEILHGTNVPGLPHLVILDDLDYFSRNMTNDVGGNRDQDVLRSAIHEALPENNVRLLISRTSEAWLGVPFSQSYRLPGFSHYDMMTYASGILEDVGLRRYLEEPTQARYVEFLGHRLLYNPLLIKLFIHGMKESMIDEVTKAMYDGPKALFHSLLRFPAVVMIDNDLHPEHHECYKAIAQIAKTPLSNAYTILSLLSVCTNIIPEAWIDHAFTTDEDAGSPESGAPSRAAARVLISSALTPLGLMGRLDAPPPASSSFPSYHRSYIWVSPIFTNCMRFFIDFQTPELAEMPWETFTEWNIRRAHSWFDDINSVESRQCTMIEALNFMAALNICLADLTTAPSGTVIGRENWRAWGSYILLNQLWTVAVRSQTLALKTDLLVESGQQLFDLIVDRLKRDILDQHEHLTNIDILLLVSNRLSTHFIQRSPEESGSFCSACLNALFSVPFGLDMGDAQRRYQFALCLLLHGYNCSMRGDRWAEAHAAFRLALQVCQFRSSASQSIETGKVILIQYIALSGLERVASHLGNDVDSISTLAVAVLERLTSPGGLQGVNSATLRDAVFAKIGFSSSLSILPELLEAVRSSKRDTELGKEALLRGATQAADIGDTAREYAFQTTLVDLAVDTKSWVTAAIHIRAAQRLARQIEGGPWLYSYPEDRLIRACQHGAVFLRVHDLYGALASFEQGLIERSGKSYRGSVVMSIAALGNAIEMIQISTWLTRIGLAMLVAGPKNLLTSDQFNELDDIMQALLLVQIQKRWPQFDTATAEVREYLERKFQFLGGSAGPHETQGKSLLPGTIDTNLKVVAEAMNVRLPRNISLEM